MYKEKYYIIFQPDGATLDQRSELYSIYIYMLSYTYTKWFGFVSNLFISDAYREGKATKKIKL